uniref:Uncharacterized protein n=1 Tax=Phthorimaea operculella granulovirus TaxID=192584 RepID=A0A1B2CRY7_9BBAC|nr:hypothetical protein PhopGVgp014 [Phthorimaea operculella granulovirus]QBH65849.1 hypothetical protein PhopGVgp014 [Phthorimaea operculella granulovirus]QBH66109.1 hypothetical protein PhopGVgp014 [Phthorimaea operculella granulovirus]QBH66239.1 hypothetical protein PhopGVgp014 [Phthorimaea operculella granulovirus]QBH66369.1 hypothetical protein PhopGVgp014 [Phthorimaea operculella granulovirus]
MIFVALDGVACTTKSSILARLKHDSKYCVHLIDFKMLSDQLCLGVEPAIDSMIYLMFRDHYNNVDREKRNIFDREPASAMLYRLIFANCDDTTVYRYCKMVKSMGVYKNWRSLILVPRHGQEEIVVQMMKKRNNGIDWMNVEYVKRQKRVFTIWAEVMDYNIVYIDYEKSLDRQQDMVVKMVEDIFCEQQQPLWRRIINKLYKIK